MFKVCKRRLTFFFPEILQEVVTIEAFGDFAPGLSQEFRLNVTANPGDDESGRILTTKLGIKHVLKVKDQTNF